MGSAGEVKMNWPLVVIAAAVIAVPLGIALVQDIGSSGGEEPATELPVDPEEQRRAEAEAALAELEHALGEVEAAEEEIGAWQRTAMDRRFFDEVLLAGGEDGPRLAGPMTGAAFGMSTEEVAVAARDLFRPLAHDGAALRPEFDGEEERLSAIVVEFPDDGTARLVLAAAWGEPVTEPDPLDGAPRHRWLAPDHGLMATLRPGHGRAQVAFEPLAVEAGPAEPATP